jgi:hypothetical protein
LKSKEISLLRIPNATFTEYVAHLNIRQIAPARFAEYKKWLRYYLDFCDKYPVPTNKAERVRLFCEKLKEKKQSEAQRDRAAHAVSLYFEMLNKRITTPTEKVAGKGDGVQSFVGQVGNDQEAPLNCGVEMNEDATPVNEGKTRVDATPAQESYYV